MINSIEKINTTISKPDAPKTKSAEEKDAELRKTCAAFEGMFLEMMMKSMRKASMEASLIKKNNGEKIFTEMLDQQYVDSTTKAGDTGLGSTLYEYLKATSPEYKNETGNNFPNKAVNKYEMNKIRNDSMNASRLDMLK